MPHRRILALAVALTLTATAALAATGQVQLELVGSDRGSPLAFQEWLQTFSRVGIKNVRLRSGQETDKPAIDVQGTPETPIYVVTGLLSGDQVIVPGARFRRSEAKRLAEWLDDLAQRGPADRREPVAAFGLTAKQLDAVRKDLAQPIGFATQGVKRSDAVQQITQKLGFPVRMQGTLEGGDEKIEEELSGLSCGTALACILRPGGFCLVPHAADKSFFYTVAKMQLDQEVWPIGWPPQKMQEALPAMYEFRNVNVSGVSAARLLEVLGKQLGVPILLDHNALARHDIDPEKAVVAHPQMRTNYSMALRKMLFKVGLKFEIRVDEAEKPFLWISTVKPV
jgi:hypothetical protein